MGRFIPPYMGHGERLFAQGASIQGRVGPFTVRPDDIKNDKEARQYIRQVVDIIRYLGTNHIGNALITAIGSYSKPVLVFPLVQTDEDGGAMAWVYPRWGLFPVVMSFTPLFGQRLRKHLGGNEDQFEKVFTPHETFVHELVHVARAVSGNYKRLGDDDEEELAAIVTNMFSSGINRPLITSYEEMTAVKGNVAEFSTKVYKDNFDILAAFCKQNRKLALDLSYAKVAFNPLRQYVDENL